MNQNSIYRWAFVACSLFLIMALSWQIWPFIPSSTGGGMSADAGRYYSRCIESGEISNWHSSLFIYEAIALRKLIMFLLGKELSGCAVLFAVWAGTTLLMMVAVINLGYILVNKSLWWCIALPCCVFFSFECVEGVCPVGLDYYFTCLLWCLFSAMVSYSVTSSVLLRKCSLFIFLFILLHILQYRKNSVLLVPFVLGWMLYMTNWFCKKSWWGKCSIWLTCIVVVSFLSLTCTDLILSNKKTHPIMPMLESDLRIASILRNEQVPIKEQGLARYCGGVLVTDNTADSCISAFWYRIDENRWNDLLGIYVNEWKKHPTTMCAAAVIQRIQFYSGGYSYPFLRDAVETQYPVVRNNENAWRIIAPTVHSPMKRLFWLCMAPICVGVGVVFRKWKVATSATCVTVIISGCLSALYALSYLIVVPTPDARYLAPAHMMSLFSFSVLAFAILETSGKWIYAKLRSR